MSRERWGGARQGAGRKAKPDAIHHDRREHVCKSHHLHITLKLVEGLPTLRGVDGGEVCTEAIRAVRRREGFDVFQFSIQGDHLHLLARATSPARLAAAMKSLTCRIARGLNKRWGRRGRVFAARFHAEVIRSLRHLWHTLRYVLCNHNKHETGRTLLRGRLVPDLFSSGRYFEHWRDHAHEPDWNPRHPDAHVSPPSWQLLECVRRYGRLSLRAMSI
ncbi:MAG: transposase [Planctomycetes bacterium]|nr:transposase [Planctomycetota bacterium]